MINQVRQDSSGGDGGDSQSNTISIGKRSLSETDDSSEFWKRLCGPVPFNIVRSTMDSMDASAYHIHGYPMVLKPDTVEFLKSILPEGISLSKINDDEEITLKAKTEEQLLKTHVPASLEHISVIEAGKEEGLERLMGAVIVAGENTFKITCAEIYFRDSIIDPHAEALTAIPSSVPTEEESTQYSGVLKIVKMDDIGRNKKLVIGVRAYNYLITEGFNNGNIRAGSGRCADGLEINNRTRLFIKKERQNANMLANDILSLGQLRSHFGHPVTYIGRRLALVGYGSISAMPITVFTLSQLNVPFSKIFRHLADSVSSDKKNNVYLHLKDVEKPQEDDMSIPAQITRKIIGMFPAEKGRLKITGNEKAEKALTDLANSFSGTITDRNTAVQNRIAQRILP